MTFTELVKDTRPDRERTTLEVLDEWADAQARINDLEDRLSELEAEAERRGYSL